MTAHTLDAAPRDPDQRFAAWRNLVSIATGLSVIVGVLSSLTQLAAWLNESRRANLSARLQGLGQVRNFLQADAAVRRRGRAFVRERLPQLLPRAETLMRAAGTGEDF